MREVLVEGGAGPLAQQLAIGTHTIRSDEPIEEGGNDTGPRPHELLLSALGACTAMTLRLYAARKGWPLRDVRVRLNAETVDGRFTISRAIAMDGNLDGEQRARLLQIADRCPVHRTLTGEVIITTSESAS